MKKKYLFSFIVASMLLLGSIYAYIDLDRADYAAVEVVNFSDTSRTGSIDTVTLNITGIDQEIEPAFFMISGGRNNFPWDSNVSKIEEDGIVKITAPSGIATVRSPGFRVRTAQKGNPNLNIVTDLQKDFVCQPAIKNPYFQVWEESIKVEGEAPFHWEPGRDHSINYTKTENGVHVKGRGAVLTQSTDSLPDSVPVKGNGSFRIIIKSSQRFKIEESFSGSTDTSLDTSILPSEGEHQIRVESEESFTIQQLGRGVCINGLN